MKNRQAGFAHLIVPVIIVVGIGIFGVVTLLRSEAARRPANDKEFAYLGVHQEEIESRSSGSELRRQSVVISNQDNWKKIWAKYHADVTPVPDLPEVDFTKDRVLVVSRGQQTSGGNGIKIANVAKRMQNGRARIEAVVTETNAGEGCFSTSALQSPYQMVRILNETEDRVSFSFKTETVAC